MTAPAGAAASGSESPIDSGALHDVPASAHEYAVRSSRVGFEGKIISVRTDDVAMPGGVHAEREVVVHPGAVGIVALDESDRVLLIRQYRHPVGRYLWELPAGLLDVPDEPASQAAARELAEEAGLRASEWHVLVDGLTSPGMTDEAIRVFLARGIAPVADDERFEGEHEEAELHAAWVPLDDVLDAALRGEIENVMCLLGVFTVAEARRRGYAGLRSVDVDWPTRPRASG